MSQQQHSSDPRPLASGTPYEDGTVEVAVLRGSTGETVIQATFGNVFSETVIPMTHRAAVELHDRLAAALWDTIADTRTLPDRPTMEAFLVDQRDYSRDVVESLTDAELVADYEAEGGDSGAVTSV